MFFRLSRTWVKIDQILVIFWNKKILFFNFVGLLVSQDITSLYFLADILYIFNKSSLSKNQFCEISKSTEALSLMTLKSNAKFKEKLNITWGIWWIFTHLLESLKTSLGCALFCPKYIKFVLKKNRGVIFHDTEESWKISINTLTYDFKNCMKTLVEFL